MGWVAAERGKVASGIGWVMAAASLPLAATPQVL
jgi:hypothetical protein